MEQSVLQTIDLPHCWICGIRFVTSIPPGPAQREDHHIIPRAFGGSDGPTVSICDTHHSALHKIAHRMLANKPWDDLTYGTASESRKRLEWLASRVAIAERAAKDDPNKRTKVTLSLNGRQRDMLQYLKTVTPAIPGHTVTSQVAALEYALELAVMLHQRRES